MPSNTAANLPAAAFPANAAMIFRQRPPPGRLLALAREYATANPFLATSEGAFGLCFDASLEIAALAHAEGLAVDLLHWDLVDDDACAHHFAVSLGDGRVIDLTRAQVDGQTGLVWRIADYPANYLRPQCYPASLFLPELLRTGEVLSPCVSAALERYDGRHLSLAYRAMLGGLAAFFGWHLAATVIFA